MKQTAVEQLIDKLETLLNYKVKGEAEEDKPVFEIFQQALEMEKQQIVHAFVAAQVLNVLRNNTRAEQYYSETYKPEAE
jgi:hypothetical protein